ncbi:MAG: polysaccharide biosynthesis tyrosine autokinase, partial [Isosphaeraceae bacterium]
MQQRYPQHALNANGSPPDGRKLLEDFHHYKGIIFRGWRFILICVLATSTAAMIYLAAHKPTYMATSRLLVIQQSSHPIHVGGGNAGFDGHGQADDNLATHLLLLKSPVIIDQALVRSGLKSISIGAVIANLTVKQPDPAARIVDLTFKSGSANEAQVILDEVIESYKLFLKSHYQKNSSDVIGLITKARNELNEELKSLERAYLEYRQKNPAYSADSDGHTFVARRLDQWDRALNQFSARSVQLQSQLELGKKMSLEGVDPATIVNTLNQVGMIGADLPSESASAAGTAAGAAMNDGSYISMARELAEVESRRKTAELFLEHFERENQGSAKTKPVPHREIERRFLEDPEVADLRSNLLVALQRLAECKRVARSATDPSITSSRKRADALQAQYQRLWEAKSARIAESLTTESNPDVGAGYRAAEAELITLKARESALRDRLDHAAAEELQNLRAQADRVRRERGPSDPLVARLERRIASLEARRREAVDSTGRGDSGPLIDYMTQSLESIEAIRKDLQKKFDEDLALAKKADIALVEESNLRSNLERQRSLFNSVVDQLKQARLVSDYDSVSTQIIAPTAVAADRAKTVPILLLAVVVGIGLGMGIAFLAEFVEARVRTLPEIRKLVDVPLIGIIPSIEKDRSAAGGMAGLISHLRPRSAFAESYKATRTSLEFLRRNRQAQVLLITSPLPGDGKTSITSNLAISLAGAGRRVLVVDGDLRKPSQHRLFDVECEGGLSDALSSCVSPDRLVRSTFIPNLDLLTAGRDFPNPAELL